ncbi:MAG: S-layer homology domain-containing protein, partial [Eubacteriales bacterium]
MMKRFAKVLVGVLLAFGFSAAVTAEANLFTKSQSYTPGFFSDVSETAWYASEVAGAYELGLMNGVGNGSFAPEGEVTVAETVTMAARAAASYYGETIDSAAYGEWYAPYVAYAAAKGMIAEGQFDSFDRPAKRREVAQIFKNALPESWYAEKNAVASIPDVSQKQPYFADLLTLYRAGVVMGSDEYGNFYPENNITRAEAAAILNRVALPENRLVRTLKTVSADGAYVLVRNTTYSTGSRAGINSGWLLDNRGGVPRTDVISSYNTLNDISAEAGTALIREFNKITTGKLLLRTKLLVGDLSDGVYLAFQNADGDSVYRLEIKDGCWCTVSADGSFVPVYRIAEKENTFVFHIEIDLDNASARTDINYTDCGSSALAVTGEAVNLLNFRFATTDACMTSLIPGAIEILANYGIYEDFTFSRSGSLPYGWTGSGDAAVSGGELVVKQQGFAQGTFAPVSGTVISEFRFLARNREQFTFALKSGDKTLVTFVSDGTDFFANGVKVYADYVPQVWYRFRAEADTVTQTVSVKVNGRDAVTVPFEAAAASADSVTLSVQSEGALRLDNLRVYDKKMPEDYVPEPVRPVGEEKYTVGINVCSIWQNGFHHGWNVISPYADREPVLGYYEEGIPETADWEIKYMVEHGIDFQAFCWFAKAANAPLKDDQYENLHLTEGYMNAEYADRMKYCILWEAANGACPANKEAWENYFVPTWIEHFFKDERYMTIDNKAVMAIFGFGNVVKAFGGEETTRERLNYLRDEVKKLGYEDLIILSSHATNSESLQKSGLDGCIAYNWGTSGYQLEHNKKSILSNASKGFVYTVPTVSVGFNSIAWWGTRYPMMSMADFKAAQDWVKNEYLPTYATEDWQKNFVWLSTWNEYGEGTFLMPTTDEKGFGYLDVLREAYTDEAASAAVNTVPTPAQKARITHRYPAYRYLLRREGYVKDEASSDYDNYDLLYRIDFATEKNFTSSQISEIEQTADGISGISGADAIVWVNRFSEEIDLSEVDAIRVRIQAPKGTILSLFHITSLDSTYDEEKRINITHTTSEMTDIIINASSLKKMNGILKGLRIDPVNTAGNRFTLQSVELLSARNLMSKEILINGNKFNQFFTPGESPTGDCLVAFDPGTALDFGLDCFHLWDKEKQELTLYFKNHTVVYTVGSDSYLFDGQKKALGYTLTALDGLPLIPLDKLCAEVGYEFSFFNNRQIVIRTDNASYFEQVEQTKATPGSWEFNITGSTEGWTSSNLTLLPKDGILAMNTTGTTADVQIFRQNLELNAEQYESFEFKARYQYDAEEPVNAVLYFTTDRDGAWNEE